MCVVGMQGWTPRLHDRSSVEPRHKSSKEGINETLIMCCLFEVVMDMRVRVNAVCTTEIKFRKHSRQRHGEKT